MLQKANPSQRVNPTFEKGYPPRRVDPGWLLSSCKRLKRFDWRRADPLRRVGANPGSCKQALRTLCIEIYKTVSKLNPPFMQDIFKIKQTTRSERNPIELIHQRPNQVTVGSKSLLSLGPRIWNALPKEIKLAGNIPTFKRMIKHLDGPTCGCNISRQHRNIHIT